MALRDWIGAALLPDLGMPDFGIPGERGGNQPGTAGGQNAGQLRPHDRKGAILDGVEYRRVPVWPPFANLAADNRIAYQVRFRWITFGGNTVAAGPQAPIPFQFSQPTIIIGRVAAAIDASGAATPVGRQSLDLFTSFWIRIGGNDAIDSTQPAMGTPMLGSALYGNGQLPALMPGNGLFFDRGSALQVNVSTLINNVRADIGIICLEEYGPPRG